MAVLPSLAPVFLVILTGFALRRLGLMREELVAGTNRLCFYVGMPAMLIDKLATAHFDAEVFGAPSFVMIAGMGSCIVIAYLFGWLLRSPRSSLGALVQGSYRSNLAFVGLSLLINITGSSRAPEVLTGVMLMAVMVPLYNIIATIILSPAGVGHPLAIIKRTLISVFRNPLVVSIIAGIAWSYWRLPMPVWAGRTLEALGQMSLPLALLGIGATLRLEHFGGRARLIAAAVSIKCLLGPAIGWGLGRMAGLSDDQILVIMVMLGCPTAAASFIMADQLGADRALAAGCVTFSTIFSFFSLWGVLVWMG